MSRKAAYTSESQKASKKLEARETYSLMATFRNHLVQTAAVVEAENALQSSSGKNGSQGER